MGLLSRSLFTRLIAVRTYKKWWAGDSYRTGISIAFAIRSFDLFVRLIPPYT